MRREATTGRWVLVVCNVTPQSHAHYRVGVPVEGYYAEVFNTDAERYGGSNLGNLGNLGGKFSDAVGIHGYDQSLDLCLPPLSVLVLRRDEKRSQELCDAGAESGAAIG